MRKIDRKFFFLVARMKFEEKNPGENEKKSLFLSKDKDGGGRGEKIKWRYFLDDFFLHVNEIFIFYI